jgi:hypothetical protein
MFRNFASDHTFTPQCALHFSTQAGQLIVEQAQPIGRPFDPDNDAHLLARFVISNAPYLLARAKDALNQATFEAVAGRGVQPMVLETH